jgi:hypothetical protein
LNGRVSNGTRESRCRHWCDWLHVQDIL